MKLSRTGWNNVIIFSVMAFILVINIANNKLFLSDDDTSSTTQSYILGEHATILTLSINPTIRIERIGKNWRSTPTILTEQALEQMMRSWHQNTGTIVNNPPELDQQMALVVNIELASQDAPQILQLYVTDTELLIYNQTTNVWLSLPTAIFSQLIPHAVLAA
jgi:hypothetical protein